MLYFDIYGFFGRNRKLAGFFFLYMFVSISRADDVYWYGSLGSLFGYQEKFPSWRLACQALANSVGENDYSIDYNLGWAVQCRAKYNSGGMYQAFYKEGEVCGEGRKYNNFSGVCDTEKGGPKDNLGCNALVGNPVSALSGNKIQMAGYLKYGIMDIYVFYNSEDGVWRGSYSDYLEVKNNYVRLIRYDGSEVYFSRFKNFLNESFVGSGRLIKEDGGWVYMSPDSTQMRFDDSGRLEQVLNSRYGVLNIEHAKDFTRFCNSSVDCVVVRENENHQLVSVRYGEMELFYSYGSDGQLGSISTSYPDSLNVQKFHYEDPRDPKLLTGITDERGVRYATWSYDDQGRAISSEHAGGAEKVTLAYNDDGSTTVTNALGKQTTYRFQVIQGVKRITAIEGEPSADCPAANSTYTYNDRGQVLTATDAEGRVTRYAYNDRGLEISRIEGEGTAEARTVTTEWDAERYRRTQVTADGRRTLYSYDDQGRLLSERTEAVSAN